MGPDLVSNWAETLATSLSSLSGVEDSDFLAAGDTASNTGGGSFFFPRGSRCFLVISWGRASEADSGASSSDLTGFFAFLVRFLAVVFREMLDSSRVSCGALRARVLAVVFREMLDSSRVSWGALRARVRRAGCGEASTTSEKVFLGVFAGASLRIAGSLVRRARRDRD